MDQIERPWGSWSVLETGPYYKIKKLVIKPHQSISKQYHNYRSETWCIVQGIGSLTIEGNTFHIRKGDSFSVNPGEWHQVVNDGDLEDLIAIEVQMGTYCEEDDIVRWTVGIDLAEKVIGDKPIHNPEIEDLFKRRDNK